MSLAHSSRPSRSRAANRRSGMCPSSRLSSSFCSPTSVTFNVTWHQLRGRVQGRGVAETRVHSARIDDYLRALTPPSLRVWVSNGAADVVCDGCLVTVPQCATRQEFANKFIALLRQARDALGLVALRLPFSPRKGALWSTHACHHGVDPGAHEGGRTAAVG